MIYQNVEFQNFDEAIEDTNYPGAVCLQRVPETLRLHLNKGAQDRVLSPACGEIRFVSESTVKITLSCVSGSALMIPFFGEFQMNQRFTIGEEPQEIELGIPERIAALDPRFCEGMMFAKQVIRLALGGGQIRYHGIEGEGIRPPKKDEIPKRRYLSYGTSITHGASASAPHLTYVSQVARLLNADLINLGVGGACQCENEFADYIAARKDWDIATLALSVNMIGARFPLDEFYNRVSYMIDTVAGADTKRHVFCITIYPHGRDFGQMMPSNAEAPLMGTPEEYRQQLRNAVSNCPHPNVHLLEGPAILKDIGGLSVDLIHPADHGMIQMGANIAQAIRQQLALP